MTGPVDRRHDDEDAAAVIAALVAIVGARDGMTMVPAPPDLWAAPSRQLREDAVPGPHGWWASGLPR